MALQAKQTAQQRLVLAPNMTLALEVLRMPAMELQAFLRQQAEENPLIEIEEAQETEEQPATAAESASETEESPKDAEDKGQDKLGEEDWTDHWRTAGAAAEDPDNDDDTTALESRVARPESFHESLKLQLRCQSALSEEDRRLGEMVIHHLDDYGYLEGTVEDLAKELQVSLEKLESVLKSVQRLDPPGVGARDLRECLMIQLEQRQAQDTLAYRMIRDHFPDFIKHQFSAIAKATSSHISKVEEACALLKRLNPRPGAVFLGDLPPTVVPDLVIIRRERHPDVELNDQNMPQLAISRAYYRMLKSPNTPPDAKEFLVTKFRRASWLIKAIDERNATMLAIGRCLISLQREFVEHGPRALKPLTQAQVAHLIGRHPSTISRAIAGKTMDTPYGVFRLEEFFASGIAQEAPEAASADTNGAPATNGSANGKHRRNGAAPAHHISDAQIKSEMSRLVQEEDPAKPLSDQALATHLAGRGMTVARRTIAKYRTHLKILPAHLRKRRF